MTAFLIFVVVTVVGIIIVASRASTHRNRSGGHGSAERIRPDTPYRTGSSSSSTAGANDRRAVLSEPLRWSGRGEAVTVHGFEIRDPLTYIGSQERAGRQVRATDPSQIDRSLPVTAAAGAPPLPYWPWYAEMTPEQRCLYLRWLASDRKSLPPADGYLFVYFYGLERRALVDNTDHDLVFIEVQRLRAMHAAHSQTRSRSFQNYSSAFLWYLVAVHGAKLKPGYVKALVQSTMNWTEDSLAAALASFAARQYPLPPWMAYVVAQESPLSQRSVVVQRVSEEFRKLFTQRVEAEFGKGMLLRSSKRDRQVKYRPASAALQPLTTSISNALGIPSQFRRLSEIWNDCVAELRKLSSVARDGPPKTLTPEAWEAMPPELRAGIDHPRASTIYGLIVNNTDESGHTFLPIADLAAVLGIKPCTKLTAKHSRSVAATAEYAGFAIEPDVRLTGRNYDWEDLVAVFPHAYESEPDYKRFGGAACILRLGMEIAEADGRVDDEELGRVMGQIEAGFQLNEHERRRLESLRTLLVRTGSDVAGLGKRLQAVMRADERRAIGALLVAVAGIDGVITKRELAALRRCFRALDLPPDLLETTIGELAPSADEAPIRVAAGRPAPAGELIPAPAPRDGSVSLDRARIIGIMEETREVSMLLAEAMRVEAEQDGSETTRESVESRSTPSALPAVASPAVTVAGSSASDGAGAMTEVGDRPPSRYAAFYTELVAKERWVRAEADTLARRHGHMLSGALEAVNDWAFDRVGGQLVYEDGDCIVVEKRLLENIAT